MPFFLTVPSVRGLMQKLITRPRFPSFIVLHRCWLRYNLIGYNFKDGAGWGVEGVKAAFQAVGCFSSAESHLAFNACRWLRARPLPGTGTGPGAHLSRRFWLLLALSDLDKQLHRGSQVSGIFNFEANEISIVQARTHPAFPPTNYKGKAAVSF